MLQVRTALSVLVLALLWPAATAIAQPLGTFRWQLLPYCNVLTLNVSQQGSIYTLDGTDDRCGAGQAASARGIAFLNPNGTIGFGVTMVQPSGVPVHLESTLTLPAMWHDADTRLVREHRGHESPHAVVELPREYSPVVACPLLRRPLQLAQEPARAALDGIRMDVEDSRHELSVHDHEHHQLIGAEVELNERRVLAYQGCDAAPGFLRDDW